MSKAPARDRPECYPHSVVTSGIVKMEQMIDKNVHCIMGRASLPYCRQYSVPLLPTGIAISSTSVAINMGVMPGHKRATARHATGTTTRRNATAT